MPASPEQRLGAFDHGTRIAVRDLFGSMPVRVKQRAILSSERSLVEKEWSQLIKEIISVLLSWVGTVSVVIREASSQHELRLKPPDESTPSIRASRLFTQASLADLVHKDFWESLSASSKHVSIKGCVSVIPVATKRAQFISFGIHPVTNESGANVLFEEINQVFSNSCFGSLNEAHGHRHTESDYESAGTKSFKYRKGIEKWPMFYFQVQLREPTTSGEVDHILDNRSNDLSRILNLFKAICYGFLKKHHQQPKKVQTLSHDSVYSTSKSLGRAKRKQDPLHAIKRSILPPSRTHRSPETVAHSSLFQDWPRLKIGHATKPNLKQGRSLNRDALPLPAHNKQRLIGSDGKLLRAPFDDEEESTATVLGGSQYFHNRFTGRPKTPEEDGEATTIGNSEIIEGPYNLAQRPKPPASQWLQGVLSSWENPVFENVPAPIPKAHEETPQAADVSLTGTRSKHFVGDHERCGVNFEAGSVNLRGRISKVALSSAEVLSQVDRKFILVRLRLHHSTHLAGETTALIMLDQHAIDERCKLEDLMGGYFVPQQSNGAATAATEFLAKSQRFDVSSHEGNILHKAQAYFKSWGIVYEIESGRAIQEGGVMTIKVTSLPPSILERCATEPRLLIDILRKGAWELEEGHRSHRPPSAPAETDHPWVSLFSQCPRGILELLHSRSCRSAVMFNDVLTQAECEAMVRRVAKCAFPFQCAHGRPSMVPLVDTGSRSSINRVGGWQSDAQVIDWKRWMR